MADDIDFTKLPVEECCSHKVWKARVHGYTEAAKLFGQADDEKAPIFNQYLGLISKMVSDSNAAAQEKGLEAALLFIQNAAVAGKIVKDIMSTIVTKCIGAPKMKTKDLSVQIALMYIETEKHEVVQEELLKGMQLKNPKTVSACISAMSLSLKEFGFKVIDIKPLIKIFPTLLEDRDKTVRDEAKNMIVEIYRWINDALKPKLSSLKPVQLTELEAEFEKVKSEKPVPNRYLRSQQVQQVRTAAAGGTEESQADAAEGDAACNIDPYELVEPLNVLSKLPPDFYKNLEAKKWQERKEVVEALEKVLDFPKFEKADYGDLVRALMKVVTKDSNVVVVGFAVKCIARLASGLKKNFQTYAGFVFPSLLEKFKEKKANVVQPLREAVDATFVATTFESTQEDIISSLENKNPSVKAETASFLARAFAKSTPTTLNKKIVKVFTTALLKTLNESDPTVRDSSAEALGTAMKVVGEKGIMPFMTDLDNLKLTKIKECCEKAVVVKPVQATRTAAPKVEKEKQEQPKAAVVKKVTGGARKPTPSPNTKSSKTVEKEMTQEEVDEIANEVFSEEVVKGLADGTWKTRLESVESFTNTIKIIDSNECPAQVLIKTLAKKPGFKDTNVQVLKVRLEALKFIAENFVISASLVELVLQDIIDKLGDAKNGILVAESLTALSESTSLDLVARNVIDIAFQQKSPKVQQEALNWLSEAVKEFGFVIDVNAIVDNIRKALNATNASVRTSSVSLCAVLHMYMGQQLMNLLNSEKQAVISLITAEIEKHAGESPPVPVRGAKKGSVENFDDTEEDKEEKTLPEPTVDTVPRVDISSKITDELIAELGDKNWKVRNEALTTLQNIVKDAKCIKSNLGELPPVLAQRLNDSNGKLALLALEICNSLALAMGPSSKVHIKTFFRGFLSALGDNKQWVRQSALTCINTWGTEGGYKEFFEGEMVPDALKTGSPSLRTEVWNLLSEILPNIKEKSINKEELLSCLPHLYTNLEDRNSDVRKAAQSAVLGMMIHLGYQAMVKQAEKLKPGSKTVIMTLLDKTRPDLPAKPEVKSAKPKKEEVAKPEPKSAVKTKVVAVKPTVRKKEEEVDLTPILSVNNLKQQRIVDEQRLKTLKWNFTLPRAEFVDLLKEQMMNAKLNKTLIANMFHADFKYHLKAIDSLNEELSNTEAIVSNLDLILKWMTLRFFDTNPSVLLKGLEYLQNVFTSLIDSEYTMFDSEANSFIPYLVLKIGDQKDAVRDRVKGILKQISVMYSSSKLFTLIMEGLKSKNARQRSECLDELGNLIEQFGLSVCQPTPSAALKEIAKQISDRDNSVRNGALNAIVKAWFLEGDKIYKMIGSISEKDSSLLAERIRRAAKNRPNASISPKQETKPKVEVVEDEPEEEEVVESELTVIMNQATVKEDIKPEQRFEKMNLIEIDDTFLNSPVQIPEFLSGKYGRKETTVLTSPTEQLSVLFQDLASTNINTAYNAASRLRFHMGSPEVATDEHVNQILSSLVVQLNFLNSYTLENCDLILPQTYKILLRLVDDIFFNKTSLGYLASVENLQSLIHELLYGLVEERTVKFHEGGYGKLLQVYLSRIIENSNFTNVTCAVIKLLYAIVANPPSNPKFTDVATKCLLKIIVTIKKNASAVENDLNLDKTLYECHLFFQAFPQHTWKDRPSNLPLKAIKTLLLTLVQLKGKDIFSHLSLIENPCAAEVCLYLKKLIKSKPELNVTRSSTRLTKAMSEHLSEVFMKIAYDGTAKEGLMQFYEFKKRNPNVDLTPYLAPTSKYFQDYVENGLKEIEREMTMAGTSNNDNVPAPVINDNFSLPSTSSMESFMDESSTDNQNLAQYYLDKLKLHYKKAGLPPPEYPNFEQN